MTFGRTFGAQQSFDCNPVVPLRSTTGYYLLSLRLIVEWDEVREAFQECETGDSPV